MQKEKKCASGKRNYYLPRNVYKRAYLGSSDKKDRGLMGTIINFQRRMSILGDAPKKKNKHDLSTEEVYGKT